MPSCTGRRNLVKVYNVDDDDGVVGACVSKLIALAAPQRLGGSVVPQDPRPIEIDAQRRTSDWELWTKYYVATVCFQIVSYPPDEDSTLREPEEAQAVVGVLHSEHQESCLSLVRSLSSSSAGCCFVIWVADSCVPGWCQDVCSENGLACYNAAELGEASMALQCCDWPDMSLVESEENEEHVTPRSGCPRIKRHSLPYTWKTNPSIRVQPRENTQITACQPPTLALECSLPGDRAHDAFDDEFTPFVGGSPGRAAFDECISSDLPTPAEVEQTARLLFFNTSAADDGDSFDLESLVTRLDHLRTSASEMDQVSRRKFAAAVALAVESKFGLD